MRSRMPTPRRDPVATGVAAAVSLAREHGLRVEQPRVLSETQAVVVHLPPVPLVARIGVEDVFGPRVEWQRGAVGLAGHLAAAGAAVIPPSELLPPGPHERDGAVVSFWSYVEEDDSTPVDPREVGASLREIHELAGTYDGELAGFWPLREAEALLAHPEVTAELREDDLGLLAAVLKQLAPELPTPRERALHGDAHIWNALQTRDGAVWFDFDEACRGPLEWDAATMIQSDWVLGPKEDVRTAYRAAFGDRFEDRELVAWVDLRVILIIEWLAVSRHRSPALREPTTSTALDWLRRRYPDAIA